MTVTNAPTPPLTSPDKATGQSQQHAELDSARSEYLQRLEDRRVVVRAASLTDDRMAMFRGLVFFGGIGLLLIAWNVSTVSTWFVLLPISLFTGLVVYHGRVINSLTTAKRAVAYYEFALARIDDRWMGMGPDGARYIDSTHPYTSDLDVFGPGSLFQLLSSCRTRLGEDTLAGWLSRPADPPTVQKRQVAVVELRNQLDLRERLALLDAQVHDDLDQNLLLDWAKQRPVPVGVMRRILAVILACAAIAGIVLWAIGSGVTPLVIVLVAEASLAFTLRGQLKEMIATLPAVGSGLAILSQVLQVLEAEQFEDGTLQRLRQLLDVGGVPPSKQIAKLGNRIQALNNSLQNQFFMPFAFVLCLHVHIVHAIERWRDEVGSHITDWLEAVGEFEALCSLAGQAYERAEDVFPTVVEEDACFNAEELGHPLLPEADCVRNSVSLNREKQLLMISGSNMSGKSTLLRAVGTNAVLALAGAPVRAKSMRLSKLAVGTTMRMQDSLQKGASLFYTSVSRLKQIVDLSLAETTLLFLFDEILQGTNSHDRRVGAEGIVRQLIERQSLGLVTTHDLALTEIVDSLNGRAENMHFEDRLVDGKMEFDYNLQPGIVRRSNALALMKMVGLEVDDSAEPQATDDSQRG